MTPEREKYLAKCSKMELVLRHWIKVGKGTIARHKFGLNYDETFTDDDVEYCLGEIRFQKDRINCYRHELQRLKGMDRAFSRGKAPVKQQEFHSGIEYSAFYCGDCGYIVEVVEDDGEFKKVQSSFARTVVGVSCGRR